MNPKLTKILEALLISTSEPLTVKDILKLFRKYEEQLLDSKKTEDEENNVNSLTSQVNTLKSLVETLKNNQNVIIQKLDKLTLNMNGNGINNQDEATALA